MSKVFLLDRKIVKAFKDHVTEQQIKDRYQVKELIAINKKFIPKMEDLEEWNRDGGCFCTGPCACWVEPDGVCGDGYPSWLMALGYI